jgi:hypothetical protein
MGHIGSCSTISWSSVYLRRKSSAFQTSGRWITIFDIADDQVPAVIFLERLDSAQILDIAKLPVQLDSAALFKDVSVAW